MDQDEVLASLPRVPFMDMLGIKPQLVTPERSVLSVEMKEELTNPYGMTHGGVFFTIADCCAGLTARADGRKYVTMDSQIHYLRQGPGSGTLTAESHVIKRGKTTCVVGVTVNDEAGRELVFSTFTMFCLA